MIFPYFGSGSKTSEDLPGEVQEKEKKEGKKKGEEETKENRKRK